MITVNSDTPFLGIPFAKLLDFDIIKNLKQGKGGHVTVKGTQLFIQLQKMNLVVSHEDKRTKTTDLYLIDELYDLFAPYIVEAMKNPVDYNTDKSLKTPLDAVIFEISYKCRELLAHIDDWTKNKHPKEFSKKELIKLSQIAAISMR